MTGNEWRTSKFPDQFSKLVPLLVSAPKLTYAWICKKMGTGEPFCLTSEYNLGVFLHVSCELVNIWQQNQRLWGQCGVAGLISSRNTNKTAELEVCASWEEIVFIYKMLPGLDTGADRHNRTSGMELWAQSENQTKGRVGASGQWSLYCCLKEA